MEFDHCNLIYEFVIMNLVSTILFVICVSSAAPAAEVGEAARVSRSKHYRRNHKRRYDHHRSARMMAVTRKTDAVAVENFQIAAGESHIYVDSQSGNDANSGSSSAVAVKSLTRALTLVKNKPRPLSSDVVVHLSGVFESERLILDEDHAGSSSTARVVFRGNEDGSTRLLGGNSLNFVKVTSLSETHPARQLAALSGTSLDQLYAAAPPLNFPSNNGNLKYPDGDCRDLENYRKSRMHDVCP